MSEERQGRALDQQRLLIQRLDGVPYFAFVPARLPSYRVLFESTTRENFNAIDISLRSESPIDVAEFSGFLNDLNQGIAFTLPNNSASKRTRECVAVTASLAKAEQISAEDLLAANGKILGERKPKWRNSPMWIGAAHPWDSWYVAPPPSMTRPLVRDLGNFIADRSLPASLRASVALLRLLQIHPFSDGNGRTSRALFLAVLIRQFGFRRSSLGFIDVVWNHRAMSLHDSSLRLKSEADWSPYLSLCAQVFRSALREESILTG